jgi:raffinose/stachyose/melibiose transport system substrate-binding protein
MRRRILTTAALLAGGALALSACAPSADPGSTSDAGDDVTLTVWSWRTEDVDAYNRIFDVFEKDHPGITVEFEAFQNTEYNQILTTGLAGSDGPDVPMVRAYGQLQPNIEAGQLEPIDGEVDGLDGIAESVIAGAKGKADGKTYAVPLATQTLQMFYNKKIFAEQGLSVPTTTTGSSRSSPTSSAAPATAGRSSSRRCSRARRTSPTRTTSHRCSSSPICRST